MNLDAIAERVCRQHVVLSPHGSIPPDIDAGGGLTGLINLAQEWGGTSFPWFDLAEYGVTMSEREDPGITNQIPYLIATHLFPYVSAIVIVGYSFARVCDSIDDAETYRFIEDMLKRHPVPVVVVDRRPEFTAGLIDQAHTGLPIHTVEADWRPLAVALRQLSQAGDYSSLSAVRFMGSSVRTRYSELQDVLAAEDGHNCP